MESTTAQSCSVQNCLCPCHHAGGEVLRRQSSSSLSASARDLSSSLRQTAASSATVVAKPQTDDTVVCAPPPPPPLPGLSAPPPPPLPPQLALRSPQHAAATQRLMQQDIPSPRRRLRKVPWTKLNAAKVSSKPNFWTTMNSVGLKYQINFDQVEEFFSLDDAAALAVGQMTEVTSTSSLSPVADRKRKEEVNMLDSKRSLNLHIFLRQFRSYRLEIIDPIRMGNCSHISVERLRGLIKILPEQDEVDMLKSYKGNESMLGIGEKFLTDLIRIPHFRLRVESMLNMAEFSHILDWLKPAIDAVMLNAKDIHESRALQELLFLVVKAGNFLNAGLNTGDAVGISLSSLARVADTRTNKPRLNMMHWIAQTAEANNSPIMSLATDLKYLKESSQYSVEGLKNEVIQLRSKVTAVSSNVNIVDGDFKRELETFLQNAEDEMTSLEQDIRELEEMQLRLAVYFCEDERSFRLEECAKIFDDFFAKFQKAVADNRIRQLQECKAEQRRTRSKANKDIRDSNDFDRFRRPASVNERRNYRRGSESIYLRSRNASVAENSVRETSADRKSRLRSDVSEVDGAADQNAPDLLSFLMKTEEEPTSFDRQGSGRRRRGRESMYCGDLRERNPSPGLSMMASLQPLSVAPESGHQLREFSNIQNSRQTTTPSSGELNAESMSGNFSKSLEDEKSVVVTKEISTKPTERRRLPAQPSVPPLNVSTFDDSSSSSVQSAAKKLTPDVTSTLQQKLSTTDSISSNAALPKHEFDQSDKLQHSMTRRSMTKVETNETHARILPAITKDSNDSAVKEGAYVPETSLIAIHRVNVPSNDTSSLIGGLTESDDDTVSPFRRTKSLGPGSFIRYRNNSRRLTIGEEGSLPTPEKDDSLSVVENATPNVTYSPVSYQSKQSSKAAKLEMDVASESFDRRRWGLVMDSETSQQPPLQTVFKRSSTLPRRWRMRQDDGDCPAQTIEEEPEDRDTPVHPSGKITALGKQKFKQLAAMYSSTDDGGEEWSKKVAVEPSVNEVSPTDSFSMTSSSGYDSSTSQSTMSSVPTADHYTRIRNKDRQFEDRSDRESVISGKDEGFDSESISDWSISQRTSMSSTLDSELTLTPSLPRRGEFIQTHRPESEYESQGEKYFARSIDSLVNRSELTLAQGQCLSESESQTKIAGSALSVRSHESVQESVMSLNDKETTRSELHLPALPTSGLTSPNISKFDTDVPPFPPKRTSSIKSTSLAKIPEKGKKDVGGFQEKRRTVVGSVTSPASAKSATPPKQSMKSPSPTQTHLPNGSHSTPEHSMSSTPATPLHTTAKRTPLSVSGGRFSPKVHDKSDNGSPAQNNGMLSPLITVNRSSPSARTVTSPAASSQYSPLVRGSPGRATMPVDLLRANKKVAADVRELKDAGAPTPPRRSSSIRLTPGSAKHETKQRSAPSTPAATKLVGEATPSPLGGIRMAAVTEEEDTADRTTIRVLVSSEARSVGSNKNMKIINVIVGKSGKDSGKKDIKVTPLQAKKTNKLIPSKLHAESTVPVLAKQTPDKKLKMAKV